MFKNSRVKTPPFSSLFAKKSTLEYYGWKVNYVAGGSVCIIYRPVVVLGKTLFFVPSGIWTDSVHHAMDYIDMKANA